MERTYKDKPIKKQGGGLKDLPRCERCGRPVKISRDDYLQDEILCSTCMSESKVTEYEDYR